MPPSPDQLARTRQKTYVALAFMIPVALLHFLNLSAYTGPGRVFIIGYLIDVALPLALYMLLCPQDVTFKFMRPWYAKALPIFAIGAMVETLQYFGIPIFGSTFDPLDYLAYAAGVLIAALLDTQVFSRVFDFWKDPSQPRPSSVHFGGKHILFLLFILLGSVVLVTVNICYVEVDKLLHPPRRVADGQTLREAGILYQSVELVTSDGVRLSAWYTPPHNGAVILVAQGTGDNTAPPDSAARLYEAAQEPRFLWVEENVAHLAMYVDNPQRYKRTLLGFFDTWLLGKTQ